MSVKTQFTRFAFREKAMREALQAYLDKHNPGLVLHEFVFSGMLEVKVVQLHTPEAPASKSEAKRLNVQKGTEHVD